MVLDLVLYLDKMRQTEGQRTMGNSPNIIVALTLPKMIPASELRDKMLDPQIMVGTRSKKGRDYLRKTGNGYFMQVVIDGTDFCVAPTDEEFEELRRTNNIYTPQLNGRGQN